MRESLLAALATKREAVDLDGVTVYARELAYASDVAEALAGANPNLALIIRCVVDADGQPVFTPADIAMLETLSLKRMHALLTACLRVNGIGEEGVEAAEKK